MSEKAKRPTIPVYRTTANGVEEREMDVEVFNSLSGDKYGWKKKADEPEEVKNLKAAPNDTGAGSGNTVVPAPVKTNAVEVAKQIYAAESVEAVNALIPEGETRKTILDAAEKRKAQLAGENE